MGKNANVVQDSVIISLANSLFSFVAGFAVFGTMGHLAKEQGVSVGSLRIGGPALMFGTYPVALNSGSGGEHWNRLLFITIFLLGIDSAFSMVEGVVTVLKGTKCFAQAPRIALVGVVCLVSFLCGLPYTTDAGLVLLDAVDYYINFVILIVGFLESFAAGWLYNIGQQANRVGIRATFGVLVSVNFAALVGAASAYSLGGKTGCAVGMMFGMGFAALGLMISCSAVTQTEGKKEGEIIWDLLFGNVEELRKEINTVVAAEGQWQVPFVWSLLIKFFIPPVLLILICADTMAENPDGKAKFGNYSNYPGGYQFIGVVAALLTILIVGLGVAFPNAYAGLAPVDELVGEESQKPASDKESQSPAPPVLDL